jgi:hypothetical protein
VRAKRLVAAGFHLPLVKDKIPAAASIPSSLPYIIMILIKRINQISEMVKKFISLNQVVEFANNFIVQTEGMNFQVACVRRGSIPGVHGVIPEMVSQIFRHDPA